MPHRSKVMIQMKRNTLVLQVCGWAWGWQPHPVKSLNCWEAFDNCRQMENTKNDLAKSRTYKWEPGMSWPCSEVTWEYGIELLAIQEVRWLWKSIWLGHLFRMQEQNPCRELTLHKPENTRQVGRPAIRWLDSVEDLKKIGITNWDKSHRIRTNGEQS